MVGRQAANPQKPGVTAHATKGKPPGPKHAVGVPSIWLFDDAVPAKPGKLVRIISRRIAEEGFNGHLVDERRRSKFRHAELLDVSQRAALHAVAPALTKS